MGCSCVHSLSPDSTVHEFWSMLPLREKPYKDIADVIHVKKQANQDISQKKFALLLESLMKSQNSAYEQAVDLFTQALAEAKKLQNEGLFFLVLLLLGKGDKQEFIATFIDLAMTVGGLKSSIIIEGKEKTKHIKGNKLEEFLEYYVSVLCEIGISILHSLYDNKALFESYWKEKVTKAKMKAFVKEELMAPFEKENVQWVDLEKFLEANYDTLKNDLKIRNYFTSDPALVHSQKSLR